MQTLPDPAQELQKSIPQSLFCLHADEEEEENVHSVVRQPTEPTTSPQVCCTHVGTVHVRLQRKPLIAVQLVHATTPQSPLCLHADEEEEPLDEVDEVEEEEPLEGAELEEEDEEPLEGAEEVEEMLEAEEGGEEDFFELAEESAEDFFELPVDEVLEEEEETELAFEETEEAALCVEEDEVEALAAAGHF